jgi:hypothetical protein
LSLSWRAHANVQRAARIRIHYLSFHQGGCGVDGASSPKAALISTWPGLPQSTSPRYAAAPRGGHHDFFYSCHKERMPFESGALLESHGRGQQTSTCVGENTPTRDIAQEISSRSRKVFADLGMPNPVQVVYNGLMSSYNCQKSRVLACARNCFVSDLDLTWN